MAPELIFYKTMIYSIIVNYYSKKKIGLIQKVLILVSTVFPNSHIKLNKSFLYMSSIKSIKFYITCLKYCHVFNRSDYRRSWIDNWIYWVTHSYTQLQCTHYSRHSH
jgi:hypothetical protein